MSGNDGEWSTEFRAGLAFFVTTSMIVSFLGMDSILDYLGFTKPEYALRATALSLLNESDIAHNLVGKPVVPDTAVSVDRQVIVKPVDQTDYLQRIKFKVLGPKAKANVYAEGDAFGKATFVALEVMEVALKDRDSTDITAKSSEPITVFGQLTPACTKVR